MPIKNDREYRAMPLLAAADEKVFESDFYVEGYATTFDSPYVLWESDGIKYYEMIERSAFDEADFSDVIMQYDHAGKVFARNKMGKAKEPTLYIEPREQGLFIAADLSLTDGSRQMYDEINKGLIYQMSWAFTVAEDSYDRDTRTRIIRKIKKVYDVSAVSIPANPQTDISARSYFDGVIEAELLEQQERQEKIELMRRELKKAQLKSKLKGEYSWK